ncbi:MAG: HEAT repeat domain-containing protein [Myxococcales bacterium]|nr:HEAT repeat domain-containing protein [Polyangiaceae bacterium]MDW8249522.1 HEAT repeat domain-containing protein [Myxococcales bacterium]
MRSTMIALLGLAAATSFVACVDPQVHPAPEHIQPPTVQPQSTHETSHAQPAGNGAQPGNNTVYDKVMVLLSGIEHIPSTEEFKRAGSDDEVVAVLDSIARDKNAKLRHRANAAAGLGHYPRVDTRKTLEALISEEGLDEVLRRPSIKAYASAFGPDAVPLISKMLDHKDRGTREAALRSLAHIRTPAARQAIEARLKIESDDALRKLGQETLARWP